jgi:hypothetical protein
MKLVTDAATWSQRPTMMAAESTRYPDPMVAVAVGAARKSIAVSEDDRTGAAEFGLSLD